MADTDRVLDLAAIIREVDGNHSKGAAALAESILDHPDFRAALARWGNPVPAPPANGEVAELVAALRTDAECVAAEQPDLMQLTDKQLTRAADLLECLEQVAYAASAFICGTRFPEFANEHGGIDRLMADLCRLVAQFEHGPRPVPGVDVPGPDGDWGGLAELCNAEGVDLRIGVPLLQRAREAWKYASQAAPVPAEGEVAELILRVQRLEDALPLPEVDQMAWQPIDTAPRDGTEILASDYDAIEIVSWVGPRFDVGITGEWTNREGEAMYPAWWQPLPDHLPLPEVGE